MKPYIKNLTDNLIAKNRYDLVLKKFSDMNQFIDHVQFDLDADDVRDMKPETLGKIMCSFEVGDVLASHLGKEVSFCGNCEQMLHELVSRALAYVILDRLDPRRPNGVPHYQRPLGHVERDVPFLTPEKIRTVLESQSTHSK